MLTANEKEILLASRDTEFGNAFDDEDPWVWAVIDESDLDPKTARGVISSLVKKQLVEVYDYEGKGLADDMIFHIVDVEKANHLLQDS